MNSSTEFGLPGAVPPAGRKQNILINAGWLTVSRLSLDLVNLVLFVVLSRRFGPAGIGQYAYGFSVAMILAAVVNLGFEDYAIRECARHGRDERGPLIGRLLGTQCLAGGTVAVILIALFAATQTPIAGVLATLLLVVSQVFVTSARTLYAPAFAEREMVVPAMMELGSRAGSIVVAILLVSGLKTDLWVGLVPLPIGAMIFLSASYRSSRQYIGNFRVNIGIDVAREAIRQSWPFAVSIFVFYFYARIDVIMLALMRSEADAGIYATALKVLEVGVRPLGFVAIAAFPLLSKRFMSAEDAFRRTAVRLVGVATLAGGVLGWGMFFVAPLGIVPLLGQWFSVATVAVKEVALLGVLMSVNVTVFRILFARNLQVKVVKAQAIATVLNVILNFWLIPILGIPGAILASIISQIFMIGLYFVMIDDRELGRHLIGIIGLSIASLAAGAATGAVAGAIGLSSWLIAGTSLLVLVGGMGVVYLRVEKVLAAAAA